MYNDPCARRRSVSLSATKDISAVVAATSSGKKQNDYYSTSQSRTNSITEKEEEERNLERNSNIIMNSRKTYSSSSWKRVMDDATRQSYYWNTVTGQTTWEMPADFEEAEKLSSLSKVPSLDNDNINNTHKPEKSK